MVDVFVFFSSLDIFTSAPSIITNTYHIFLSKQVSIPFSKLILKDRYSNFYWMFFSCFSFHLNSTPYHPITRITLNVRKWSVQSWQLLHQWHQWSKYVPYLSLQLDGMLGWVSIRIWNGMPPRKQTNDKLENSPWMSRCISYTIHGTGIFTYHLVEFYGICR